jgi:hypothetical protein
MITKTKEQPKKTLAEVMKQYRVVFSISLSDGWANISFNDKGETTVQFLNEDGYAGEDSEQSLADVQKVAEFMGEMRELHLKDYEK